MPEQTRIQLENTIIHQKTQIETLLYSLTKMRNKCSDIDGEVDKRTAIITAENVYLQRKLDDTIQTMEAPKPISMELLLKPTSITDLLDERMKYFTKMQEETIRCISTSRRMESYCNNFKKFIKDFELDSKWKVWKRRNL